MSPNELEMEKLNAPILYAFIERWQSDTNTFHMPFGEMAITIHDVHMIKGINVDGLPLARTSDDEVLTLTAWLLCVTMPVVKEWFRLSIIKFWDIQSHMMEEMPPGI